MGKQAEQPSARQVERAEQMVRVESTMNIKAVGFLAALILILTACSKQGGSEQAAGADSTSGDSAGLDHAAGSHPAELNASPGEGGLGTGATDVEPNNLANPPAPDTSGGGASSAGTGGGAGTGGSTGSAQ